MNSEIFKQLEQRENEDEHLRVGIVGLSVIGKSILKQIVCIKGIKLCILCNNDINVAVSVLKMSGVTRDFKNAEDVSDINNLIKKDIIAVTKNAMYVPESNIDIIMDFSDDIKFGVTLAVKSILYKKHIISSPEIDITVGNELCKLARDNNVYYSGSEGIESGILVNLYKYIKTQGLKITAIGKIKGYHNKFATPYTIKSYSKYLTQNIKQISSNADGTRSSIEMGITSNSIGITPDIQGMHFPFCSFENITRTLKTKEENGILNKKGVIEVIRCTQPDNGVFVIAENSGISKIEELMYFISSDNNYYLFYMPYKLCIIDMIYEILEHIILGLPSIFHNYGHLTDVATFSKKKMLKGEHLDSIGGHTFYGRLNLVETLESKKYLPIGLADGALLKRDIEVSELITLDDVEIDENSIIYKLKYNKFNKAFLIA